MITLAEGFQVCQTPSTKTAVSTMILDVANEAVEDTLITDAVLIPMAVGGLGGVRIQPLANVATLADRTGSFRLWYKTPIEGRNSAGNRVMHSQRSLIGTGTITFNAQRLAPAARFSDGVARAYAHTIAFTLAATSDTPPGIGVRLAAVLGGGVEDPAVISPGGAGANVPPAELIVPDAFDAGTILFEPYCAGGSPATDITAMWKGLR